MTSHVKHISRVILTVVLAIFLLASCACDTYVPNDEVSIVVTYENPYYYGYYPYYYHRYTRPLPPPRYQYNSKRPPIRYRNDGFKSRPKVNGNRTFGNGTRHFGRKR